MTSHIYPDTRTSITSSMILMVAACAVVVSCAAVCLGPLSQGFRRRSAAAQKVALASGHVRTRHPALAYFSRHHTDSFCSFKYSGIRDLGTQAVLKVSQVSWVATARDQCGAHAGELLCDVSKVKRNRTYDTSH
jgi:hypothetical protein